MPFLDQKNVFESFSCLSVKQRVLLLLSHLLTESTWHAFPNTLGVSRLGAESGGPCGSTSFTAELLRLEKADSVIIFDGTARSI
jgi:hypothetical protein